MKHRLLAGILLGCSLAAGCATAPAAPSARVERVFVQLQASDIEELALLMQMEDARALDTTLVGRLIEHPQAELRARAAIAAGRIRDRNATPLLLRALADADVQVRAAAAFGLGEMADSSAAVVTQLTQVALADQAPAAAEAAAALGLLGVEAARAVIDALLESPTLPAVVRQEALLAAWRLPRAVSTTAALERWTRDPDPEIRWRAVFAQMRIGGAVVVPHLIQALQDPDDRARANAARGLRASLVDSAGARATALSALIMAAADAHPHVRINALRVLPAYREPARTAAVLTDRLRDADPNVAIAAAQAVVEVGGADNAALLRQLAVDGGNRDGLRTTALHSLVRLDTAAAAVIATAWADSARWILRYHGARALGAAGWTRGSEPLLRLARDQHHLVASEAFSAIRASADTMLDLRRVYVEGLGAAHPLVRAAAVRGLGRNGAVDLDVLLQAWERARQDTVRDAALATLGSLRRLARAGVPVERAFWARFAAHGPPSDPVIYRFIADSIGAPPAAWPAPQARPAPRALAFYQDVARRLVAPAIAGEPLPQVAISTPHGDIVLELAAAEAPLTVHNFLSLVERGYYAGTRWHRVVPNFVIQDGDPRGDGSGGPGYAIRDEINRLRYLRGTLGMALSGPDTGGSQFFITHSPQPHLDGGYTIFGRVISGMDAVDRVVQEEPITAFRRIR